MSAMSPQGQLFMELTLIQTKLMKNIDRKLSAHGISVSEFFVLHQLSETAGQSMSRVVLAEAVGLTASGVTRLLNPMEKNHLVEKEKNSRDARVSLVKLTPTGQEIYQDALVSFNHGAEAMAEGMTTSQLNQMTGLLSKLK
ncbi:MarR family transcriptional regulator [Photobacterium sp. CCB-ST2H9]|uniref:MarR family winged helix-turn-helix transcriptional regulator n=1 Tax=Photobacterium sp. CCB-ST2H9 TaxID=2912855 RepID=UPI002002FA9B|nr:MarR family transcriptional regulator [Photobacterium sp. CCB-ST2H9]UTM55998.1 MarR family transcriptional regulator [Photobacterium sp. CCB-ST2H9]